jgi:hypothetical protein
LFSVVYVLDPTVEDSDALIAVIGNVDLVSKVGSFSLRIEEVAFCLAGTAAVIPKRFLDFQKGISEASPILSILIHVNSIRYLCLWYLTPLSTIFQVYSGILLDIHHIGYHLFKSF